MNRPDSIVMNVTMMRKLTTALLLLIATMATAAAQGVGGNAMVLRIDTVRVTDQKLLGVRDRQLAQGRTKMADAIASFEAVTREALKAAAGASKRFDVSDMDAARRMERELQSEMAMELTSAERDKLRNEMAHKALVVDWMLQCDITNCQFTRKGNYGWTCILHITPIVRDRRSETMRIIASRPFVSDIKKMVIRPTHEDAFNEALSTMKEDLEEWFTETFPVYARITRLDTSNDAVIDCGTMHNVARGDSFQVTHVDRRIDDDGRTTDTETVVGTIKVKDVLVDQSTCSITSGKDEIIDLNANGALLQCKMIMK